ncbi:MAG: hypothetical protein EOO11_16345 [Chitinophagaceae bacterium]|nr:MAG: hypothetical protein EOO11_16345 [Chitinophagaceae bacterium]
MNQDQRNFKASLDDVLTHFNSHRTSWADLPPVVDSVAALTNVQAEVKLSAIIQEGVTTGDTGAKDMALRLSAAKAYTMSRRIYAWAAKNGKQGVLEAVDFSMTDLTQGAGETLLARHRAILQHATDNKVELAAYKVNDAALDELRMAIDTVEFLRGDRNEKVNHRIYSTARLDELFDKVRAHFKILDSEVEGLIEDKKFVDTYFIARRIDDRNAGRAEAAAASEAAGN